MAVSVAALISIATAGSLVSAAPAETMHLEGASNARDVGGYRTTDGHMVRTGLVFRSNSLHRLTTADLARLESARVRVVDDLRTGIERTFQPDRVPASVVSNSRDVFRQDLPMSADAAYEVFISSPGANKAFAATLRDIISVEGALLYHCTYGKDRTGWMTAVLLTVLGVDRASVNQDFLLSNARLDDSDSVTQSNLDTSFNLAISTYGSFDDYVHEGLGLTDAEITTLKAKLLV
ncbi:tyrosine-protein phosphatase [Nocardia abscessus]|uniref:tyrosine-protein phosphatase n=1 Tax=Nocardia abscessus TaxID=120957 RepID=UPI002455F3CD|nr:tyrosine-protein phosphatase [Nocardia abscessus]